MVKKTSRLTNTGPRSAAVFELFCSMYHLGSLAQMVESVIWSDGKRFESQVSQKNLILFKWRINQKLNTNKNNSCNSLVFGRWPQTKTSKFTDTGPRSVINHQCQCSSVDRVMDRGMEGQRFNSQVGQNIFYFISMRKWTKMWTRTRTTPTNNSNNSLVLADGRRQKFARRE